MRAETRGQKSEVSDRGTASSFLLSVLGVFAVTVVVVQVLVVGFALNAGLWFTSYMEVVW